MKKKNSNETQDKPVYKIIKKVKVKRRVENMQADRNPVFVTLLIIALVLLLGYLGINVLLYLLDLVF